MTTGINSTIRNSRANQIRDAIDAGGAAGTIEIYNGAQPETGGATTTLLGVGTFAYPCAPDAAGGVLDFYAIAGDSSASATGDATWCRVKDSIGGFVLDMNAGPDGSGAPVQFNTTSIVAGGPIEFASAQITEGNP